jgi:hypothetical protein
MKTLLQLELNSDGNILLYPRQSSMNDLTVVESPQFLRGSKPPCKKRLSKPPGGMLYFSSHSLSCFFDAKRRQACSSTSSSSGLRRACSQRAMYG